MRVLVAFDKFKGSLAAEDACAIAAVALRAVHPDWEFDLCPLTDGGDGFARIVTTALGGEMLPARVSDPLGRPVPARFGWHAEKALGVVEMASASGLSLLAPQECNPWRTSTRGAGELLAAALRRGAREILLGIGGSATNDLALGALSALGLRTLDDSGEPVDPVPANWGRISRFAGTVSLEIPVRIACDVTNPLIGPNGAAAIYAPQKGLDALDIRRLDHESVRIALMLCHHFRKPESLIDAPGAGAAGGLGFGLAVATDAKLVSGFETVASLLQLDSRIEAADMVITGEGAFDASSLAGKASGSVAARTLASGRALRIFAGTVGAEIGKAYGATGINEPGASLETAMRATSQRLAAAVLAAL